MTGDNGPSACLTLTQLLYNTLFTVNLILALAVKLIYKSL